MKKHKYILVLLLILICSCRINQNSKEAKNGNKFFEPTIESLQGVWAEKENENALFLIKKDSLYYIEHQDKPNCIKLKEDTLLIMGDIPVHCKIIKLTQDSLWYTDEFNELPTKLYKRK